jgi:hypothetical protein
MTAIDRVQLFWEHVPRPFMERVIRCVFDAYLHADDACQDFEISERANLRPFYRRALLEKYLRGVAAQFPEQVQAKAARHEDKGFWYHTRIVSNATVVFTQNTVPDPETMVRNSSFRNFYAGPHNQLCLFPDLAPAQLPPDALLYGILLHGRSSESALFPGFAQIRFPTSNLRQYYHAKIDLFEEFPEVVQEKTIGLATQAPPEEPEIEPELLDEFDADEEQHGT